MPDSTFSVRVVSSAEGAGDGCVLLGRESMFFLQAVNRREMDKAAIKNSGSFKFEVQLL